MIFHVSIPFKKAIELLQEGTNPLDCSPNQALRELTEQHAKGKKYFTGCDNESEDGHCAGHEQKAVC